jgi:branched-chain amino acid transport system substrate-binding protein
MRRLRTTLGVAAVAVVLAATGCSSNTPTETAGSTTPYKLGLLTSSAGPFASNAKTMVDGANYAVKLINDAGGINGRKVEVIVKDLLNTPQNGATMVPELVTQAKVVALVGPVDSAGCDIACALANKLKVPIVSPGAARPGVLDPARPYAFSVAQPDAPNSTAVLTKIVKSRSVKTAAIIYDSANATTKAQYDLFKNVFSQSGVQVVKEATFTTGDASFAAQVTSIAGAKPDVIGLAAGPDDAGRIAVEVQAQKLSVILLGTGALQSGGAAYIKAAGNAAQGTLAAAQYDAHPTADPAKSLLAKAQQDTGLADIPLNFAYAFDAVNMIAAIIKAQKLNDDDGSIAGTREAIMTGLTNQAGYQGMAGTTKFGADGFSVRPALVSKVDGGKFVIVPDGS